MTLVVTHPYVSTITESTLSGGAGGLVGPTEWNQNHTLTGLASPAQGGTGITSGTGVTYFSSATVIADSGTLTSNALVVGGGANGAPATLSSLGTTSTLLHGNAAGNPSFGAVNLGSEVAGTLSTGNLTAATTALFGIVKPDNTTVTISSGVISSVGGITGSGAANQVTFWSSAAVVTGDGSFTYAGAGTGATVKLSSSTSTAGISGLSIVTSSSSNMASNSSALNITGAWNNSGTVYDAPLLMNIVNTASAAGSLLADFQLAGTSLIAVTNAGIAAGMGLGGIFTNATNGIAFFNNGFSQTIPFWYTGASASAGNMALAMTPSAQLSWYNTSGNLNPGNTPDTGISRNSPKVIQIGDGNTGNSNGWINWSGESRVAANSTTTSTALANVPGLAFKPQANRNYSFEAHLIFTDAAAGGIQCSVNATSTTTTYTLTFDGWVTDTTAVRGYAQGSAFGNAVASSQTTSTVAHVTITGTLMTSATAPSTVTIQFSQNTSNATPTTILIGSYMWAQDMP